MKFIQGMRKMYPTKWISREILKTKISRNCDTKNIPNLEPLKTVLAFFNLILTVKKVFFCDKCMHF